MGQRPPTRFVVAVGGAEDEHGSVAAVLAAAVDGAVVVAADSGVDALVASGLPVHHVVGDLDSADPDALAAAVAAGARVHRHEPDKDATDLELALDLVVALALGTAEAELLVVGPGGGRLDHLLADLLLLAAPASAGLAVRARFGAAEVTVVRPGRPARILGEAGRHVSLMAVHGPVTGVTTRGLRWPLVDAHLAPGSTRGVSNELVSTEADVAVAGGALVVVAPGTTGAVATARTSPYDPTPTAHRQRST